MANLLIPCSGPGTRSSGYTKFHKALIRVGNCAVLSHIINSYKDIDTIYVMLGYQSHLIKQYLDHCDYPNIEYIEIENWQESQFASLKQIPQSVFDQPFYLNSCDNWSTSVEPQTQTTAFFCSPSNSQYYDIVDGHSFAGMGYVHNSKQFYHELHNSTASRNDYLIYQKLDPQHVQLTDWYDVGNLESFQLTQDIFKDDFELLDKIHQEIYYVNNRFIKLFNHDISSVEKSITSNLTYPHPAPVKFTEQGLSYNFVDGVLNPQGTQFETLFENLQNYWNFCLNNNNSVINKDIWQHKTFERFEALVKKYPELSSTIYINGVEVDPVRTIEYLDWKIINTGIVGSCHGDLNLDNIIVGDDSIHYIDHRSSIVNDIFYDICKFYHSLQMNNSIIKNFELGHNGIDRYTVDVSMTPEDKIRLQIFENTVLYKQHRKKILLGVGCIWLSMSPLNVDDELNKFLFLYAIKHLHETTNELL